MKYLVTFLTFILFTLSVSGEDIKFRLGVDYRIVDNPLPVKKDGVVEVTETFWYGCGASYNFDAHVN